VASSTVTSKGQITIPQEVRERLKLKPGDRVVFVGQSDREVTLKPAKSDIRELYGLLQRPGTRRRSIEEMDEGVAQALRARHRARR
jgi:AbrB family looped-hinge helix DNA binding protein